MAAGSDTLTLSSDRLMPWFDFIWTPGNLRHLEEHGVTPDEFEEIVGDPTSEGISRRSGLPIVWGYTSEGRYLGCVYELFRDGISVLPVTAFDAPEPRR